MRTRSNNYSRVSNTQRAPAAIDTPTARLIFVGDFIDKGPAIRETLKIVRAMVEHGAALAVMGNHEYNAIAYHTSDGSGGYFREHNAKNLKQHEATLQSFEGAPGELTEYLAWFGTLPLFLDLGGLRVVHACWDEKRLKVWTETTALTCAFLSALAHCAITARRR
jgi:Predicted phosphohydrolases